MNLTVDYCRERQKVEGVIEELPDVGATILADDFLVKAVGAGYLSVWGGMYLDSWLPLSR